MGKLTVEMKDAFCIIKCPPQVDLEAAHDLTILMSDWVQKPVKLFLFDFSQTVSLDPLFYKPMVLLSRDLKKLDSHLYSINLNKELAKQVSVAGMDSAFSPKISAQEAAQFAGVKLPKPSIDVHFINPFLMGTVKVISTQANTEAKIGKPRLKAADEKIEIEIAGVISLSSKAFQGSIALCFPKNTFLGIYGSMLGESITEINGESEDAAGELLNIIFGQAKAELNEKKGYEIEKAIPTVIRGGQISVKQMTRSMAMILPFETTFGPFHLEISVDFI